MKRWMAYGSSIMILSSRVYDLQIHKGKLLTFYALFLVVSMYFTTNKELYSYYTNDQISYGDGLLALYLSYDYTQIKGAIYMYWIFRSILNEMLLSLQNNEWLRRDRANGTLRYLFNLIVEDHPTLRRIGFDTMLRTINWELSNSPTLEAIPVPIAETLYSISIIATYI